MTDRMATKQICMSLDRHDKSVIRKLNTNLDNPSLVFTNANLAPAKRAVPIDLKSLGTWVQLHAKRFIPSSRCPS